MPYAPIQLFPQNCPKKAEGEAKKSLAPMGKPKDHFLGNPEERESPMEMQRRYKCFLKPVLGQERAGGMKMADYPFKYEGYIKQIDFKSSYQSKK